MGPANLPQQHRPAGVHAPAVGAEDAVDGVAQQGGQAQQAALAMNDEGSDAGGGSHPQPTFVAGFFPTGFIHVLDVSFLDGFQRLGVGRFQGRAHLPLQRGDGAQGDGDGEDIFADGFILKPTKEIIYCDVRVANGEGKLLAQGTAAYRIIERAGD